MRARGSTGCDWAERLEHADRLPPATRPSPRPPVTARPRQLSVTEIKRLIRDPYAIYAKRILRLRPLDPLVQAPDALLRGIVLHKVLEDFIRRSMDDPTAATRAELVRLARRVLEDQVPWPTARRLWMARIDRVADWFVETERIRRARGEPVALEVSAKEAIEEIGFTLTGKADRIDRGADGSLYLYDYKTGAASQPTRAEDSSTNSCCSKPRWSKQGGFSGLDAAPVARAAFIGLGHCSQGGSRTAGRDPPSKVWAELHDLIAAYLDPGQGFTVAPHGAEGQRCRRLRPTGPVW